MMAYNLRERVPRDYAALHEGQEIDDERDEFHDSFRYHPPPALPASSQDQASSTPFSGAQIIAGAHQDVDEVAALTAAIAEVTAANETLEQETEVARLKAELHALRQRNAQLQKQSKLKPSKASPQHREPQLNIKALRSNPALTDRVSTEMERLGFSSSDSDDEQNPTTRGTRGKLKLKSGKTTKLTSRVVSPQLWPHSQLSLAYVSKDKGYDELTLAEFSAGYASIIRKPSLSETERTARLDHFIGLMYLVTQFTWPAVREFHAAVLFEIECGRARWEDSFSGLESRLLRNSSRPVESASTGRSGMAVLFCRDFQNGKCTHTKDHYGTIRNETKWLQHICAKCWTASRVIAKHSEFSADCPSKNVVSGSTPDASPITQA